jgi:uncharacterized protein (DUF427 family)
MSSSAPKMMTAVWNGVEIARSDKTIEVEGNAYFPADSVNPANLKASQTSSTCHWKGQASYYSVVVDGKVNTDAAWYYPNPSEAAKQIKGYIAFWKGVKVE